jgi:hypothetical protein
VTDRVQLPPSPSLPAPSSEKTVTGPEHVPPAPRGETVLARATVFLAGATIILAGATIILALIAACQLKAMREQGTVMLGQLDEMRSDRRPWVSADISVGNITWDKAGAHISLQYEVKNTGHSPAMHVQAESAAVPFLMPAGEDSSVVLQRLKNELLIPIMSVGFPLFPGDSMNLQQQRSILLSRQDIEKYARSIVRSKQPDHPVKSVPLVIVYVVDYQFDVEPTHHQTCYTVDVHRIIPNSPTGLAIPIDENISSTELKPAISAFYNCAT